MAPGGKAFRVARAKSSTTVLLLWSHTDRFIVYETKEIKSNRTQGTGETFLAMNKPLIAQGCKKSDLIKKHHQHMFVCTDVLSVPKAK